MENTPLYKLITRGTQEALNKALDVTSSMTEEEVRMRSEEDNSTFLHHIVNCAPVVFKREGHLLDFVPLIYRLALKGIHMNAQNTHGNTCLHLACIRPSAEALCQHFVRIGRCHAASNVFTYIYMYIYIHMYVQCSKSMFYCV